MKKPDQCLSCTKISPEDDLLWADLEVNYYALPLLRKQTNKQNKTKIHTALKIYTKISFEFYFKVYLQNCKNSMNSSNYAVGQAMAV